MHSVVRRELRHRKGVLAPDSQAFSACDEECEVGAHSKEAGEPSGCVDHVLEVVEQEQQPPVRDLRRELSFDAESLRRRLEHELGVAEGCERHPPHTIRVALGHLRRGLQREPGLAGATGAGEGDEADVLRREKRDHVRELALAAEEGGRGNREIGVVERLQ